MTSTPLDRMAMGPARRSPTAAKTTTLVANGRLVPQHAQATHVRSRFPHPTSQSQTPINASLCPCPPSARLTLLASQPHTSLLLLLLLIIIKIMIYGYRQHIPCRLPRPRHILLHPVRSAVSKPHAPADRRTLTRTTVQTFIPCVRQPMAPGRVNSRAALHY
jgi:hypothetical protein